MGTSEIALCVVISIAIVAMLYMTKSFYVIRAHAEGYRDGIYMERAMHASKCKAREIDVAEICKELTIALEPIEAFLEDTSFARDEHSIALTFKHNRRDGTVPLTYGNLRKLLALKHKYANK